MSSPAPLPPPIQRLSKKEHLQNRILIAFALLTLVIVAFVGSQSASSSDDGVRPVDQDGYWGEITASIDWCEPNYVVSPFIAEFWNTVSNLGFIVLGVYGIWAHPGIELRFIIAYVSLTLVGIGSAFFHATLKWHAQLGDEIPMFFVSLSLLYITIEHKSYELRFKWLPWVLGVGLVFFVWIYTVLRFATVFQLTWGVLTAITAYRMLLLTLSMEPAERMCFRITTLVLLLSAALWAIEQALCYTVPVIHMFQLHAFFWHIGTAFAAYSGMTGTVFARLKQVLHQKDLRFNYVLGFIPVLSYDPHVNFYSTLTAKKPA